MFFVMENTDNTPATPESVWAILKEIAASQKEADRLRKEADERHEQFRAEAEKRSAEADKRIAETDRQLRETDRQVQELNKSINGISKSNGLFAEEYFFNSFKQGKSTFFGETFEDIERKVKGIEPGFKDEYDILLINGNAVGIIEVKYKGRIDDVADVINKAHTFRVNYPKYKNHRVYLALATMIFNQRLEDECVKEGIAIVKQVGDKVIIADEHLKVF